MKIIKYLIILMGLVFTNTQLFAKTSEPIKNKQILTDTKLELKNKPNLSYQRSTLHSSTSLDYAQIRRKAMYPNTAKKVKAKQILNAMGKFLIKGGSKKFRVLYEYGKPLLITAMSYLSATSIGLYESSKAEASEEITEESDFSQENSAQEASL